MIKTKNEFHFLLLFFCLFVFLYHFIFFFFLHLNFKKNHAIKKKNEIRPIKKILFQIHMLVFKKKKKKNNLMKSKMFFFCYFDFDNIWNNFLDLNFFVFFLEILFCFTFFFHVLIICSCKNEHPSKQINN